MFRYGIHRQIVESSPVQLLFRPGGTERSRQRALDDQELAFAVPFRRLKRLAGRRRCVFPAETGDGAVDPRLLTHRLSWGGARRGMIPAQLLRGCS
jgi:hypothetical protein